MRLSRFGFFSAFSVLAVFAALNAFAASTVNFGTLKPQGKWKVGVVQAPGKSYCAMMNQFDKQVVLAFARNPEGFGSIAVDVRENLFMTGREYEVVMRMDKGKPRHFTGRANNTHAVIVQVGLDDSFYNSLNTNGALQVGLPTISIGFALQKFSTSYIALVDCADKLQKQQAGPKTVAMPVTSVEKTALQEETPPPPAERKLLASAVNLNKGMATPEAASGLTAQEMEVQQKNVVAQLRGTKEGIVWSEPSPAPVAAARPDPETATHANMQGKQAKVMRAALLGKEKELTAKKPSAGDAEQLTRVRTELAALKPLNISKPQQTAAAPVSDITLSAPSAEAQRLQAQQVALQKQLDEQNAKAAAEAGKLQAQMNERAAQQAALQQQVDAQNVKAATDAERLQSQLDERIAQQEVQRKQNDTQAAQLSANLNAKREEVLQLEKKLADAEAQRLAAVEAASKAQAELSQTRLQEPELQGRLTAAEQQKQELATRLAAAEKQAQTLQAALSVKDQEVLLTKTSSTEDSRKLAAVQAELDGIKAAHVGVIQKLQDQLDKSQQQAARFEGQLRAVTQQKDEVTAKLDAQEKQVKTLTAALSAKELELASKPAVAPEDGKKLAAVQTELTALKSEQATTFWKMQAQLNEKTAQLDTLQKRFDEQNKLLLTSRGKPETEPLVALTDVRDRQAVIERRAAELDRQEQDLNARQRQPAVKVSEIVPSAGVTAEEMPAAPREMIVKQEVSANDFLNRVMTFHRRPGAAGEASAPASAAGPVTLEGLLGNSGVAARNFVEVEHKGDSVITQWTAGKIGGMYERSAAVGDFNRQVNAYLEPYRQDCRNNLKVHTSPAEASRAGTLGIAEIECTAPSNGYSSAFLFLQDGGGFNAILHTATLSDKAEVQKIRNALAATLKRASGFAGSVSSKQAATPSSLRFNIPEAPEKASAPVPDIETVVVQ